MRMITKALLSALCLTLLTVSEASAQPQIEDLGCKNPLKRECWISSTTTTFIYLSTGLSNLLGPMTSNNAANRPELLAAYMEANSVAFTDDITVGAGPTLEDIAMLYAVSPGARVVFYANLSDQRRPMLALLEASEDEARWRKLDAIIHEQIPSPESAAEL